MADLFDLHMPEPGAHRSETGRYDWFVGADGRIEIVCNVPTRIIIDHAVRRCSYCDELKPLSEFGLRFPNDTLRFQARCNSCPR